MAQNAILVCDLVMNFSAFVGKVTISADHSGFSRSRLRSLRHISSNLRSENGLNNVELLALHKSKLRPRTLAYAFPSEEGESKSSSFDSQIPDGNDVGLDSVDLEEVSSFLYSRPDLFEDDNRPLSETELLDKLKAIRLHVLASEQWNSSRIRSCHRTYSASAKNLIHYEALKGLDIEQIKEELMLTDLMSWDIDNSCVLASLEAVIRLLESSTKLDSVNEKEKVSVSYSEKLTVASARNKACSNARLLLGPLEEEKTSHVMVTVGSEAIENETLVADLLNSGASIVRINCAHGDPSEWSEIIRLVRTSSQMTEKPCRVLMDLAGPKLRTGKLKPGPNVMKVSPKRDALGNVTGPAQVWLSHHGAGPAPIHVTPDASFLIDGPDFLGQLGVGDTVGFKDARGKRRAFKILTKFHVFSGIGLVAECTETSYIESGTKLRIDKKKCKFHFGLVIDVPASEQCLRLRVGDLLIIARERSPESSGSADGDPRITCPSSLLFDSVKPGQPISFDDGKIEGTIEGAGASEIVVSITHAKPGKGTKLGAEKSINVPESDILFQGLTSKDLVDLEFVASQADMVGVSFLRSVDDIIALRRELKNRRISRSLGIVLKIETRSGFDNLSGMIMEAMKCPNPLGIMIARGDLAVECGWERLADTQQEILSVCEAAHIPVIWATQVLETFLKSGVPTRAEITDVSTGRRANCVMLNKGRHVIDAVSFLGAMLRKS